MVINNTMPFFKMLFAQLILGEKVGKQPLVCRCLQICREGKCSTVFLDASRKISGFNVFIVLIDAS